MDQKTTLHVLFTLVSCSNRVPAMITWNTTMEDLSQPMKEIMIAGAVVIVLKAQVMYMGVMGADGGLATALIVYSPVLTPIFTGTDITASLMWR